MFCFFNLEEFSNFTDVTNEKKILEISINNKKFSYNFLINGGLKIYLNLLSIEINKLQKSLNNNYSLIFKEILFISYFLNQFNNTPEYLLISDQFFVQNIVRTRNFLGAQNSQNNILFHHLYLILCFSYYKSCLNENSEYLFASSLALFCLQKFHISCKCFNNIVISTKNDDFNHLYQNLFDKENVNYLHIDDSSALETIIFCESILNEFNHSFDFKILDRFIEETNGIFFAKIITFIQKFFSINVFDDERVYLLFNQSKIFINKNSLENKKISIQSLTPSKIINRIRIDIDTENFNERTIFENFICLMIMIFEKLKVQTFSKFEKLITTHFDSNLKQLNSTGVYHMCLYFLSFAQLFPQNTESICNEFMARFEQIGFNSKFDSEMMRCITCAYFSMYVIFRKKKIHTANISVRLREFIADIFKSYVGKSHSFNKTVSDETEFINYYLESLQDCLEYVVEDYSFFKDILIVCFSTILSSDSAGFIQRCVYISQKIVREMGQKMNNYETSDICFFILEFIRDMLFSKHGKSFSIELASLTIESLKILSAQYKKKIFDWISRVLFHTGICQNYVLQFWSNFISESRLKESFLNNELQVKLTSFWLESLFEYQSGFFSQFSIIVSKIPAFSELLLNIKPNTSGDKIFESFIISIKDYDSKLTNIEDKLSFHKKILDLLQVFKKILNSNSSNNKSCQILLYKTCAKLVELIPRIIYKKSNTACIFPLIIDKLFLLNNSHTMRTNIYENLASILCGFSHLDFENDEYIRRKLVQIFNNYFISSFKFEKDLDENPFYYALKPTFQQEDEILKLRSFFFEMIHVSLTDNFSGSYDQLMCLRFIFSVINSTTYEENNQKDISQIISITYISLLSLFVHGRFETNKDKVSYYCCVIVEKTLKKLKNCIDHLNQPSILFINIYSLQYPKQVSAVIIFLMDIDKDIFGFFPELVLKYSDKKHPIRAFLSLK